MLAQNKKIYFILALIILAGFFLRIDNLTSQSIWFDEAFSIYHSQQDLAHVINLKDSSPPLYYLLLHFWIGFFGNSEFAVRLLSVLFGTALIAAIFLISSHIFNKKVGIVSAVLVAVLPSHIYFAQEARAYALLSLLSLLSMYFYLKMNNSHSKLSVFGYLISTVLLVYSHIFGLLIVLVQNLHMLWSNKSQLSKLTKWFFLQFLIFIFYLPWLIQLPLIMSLKLYSWIPKPSLLQIVNVIYISLGAWLFSLFGILLALALLGLLVYSLVKRKVSPSLLFFIWILTPILVPFILSLFVTPFFTPKYVLFVSLPLLMLVSSFICKLRKTTQYAVISIIIILSLLALNAQQNTIAKDPWNKISEYIKNETIKADEIIINSYEILPFSYYFNPKCFNTADIYACSIKQGIYYIDSPEELEKIKGARILVILSHITLDNQNQEMLDYLGQSYAEKKSKTYASDISLAFFEKVYNFLRNINLIREHEELNVIELRYMEKTS